MSQRNYAGILAIALCGLLALVPAAGAETVTFTAGSGQISSQGVLDIAENLRGVLFFGTDNGLSYYDGSWHILHHSVEYSRQGLLSDHVLALEFDGDWNLWIGYPNGLQRLEGGSFISMQDQQLLKSLDIHGLLRREKEMWVTAGTAGLHRYQHGIWTWFRPGGPEGLGCHYISSMAIDPATDTLYVACKEGIYSAEENWDSVAFSPLVTPGLLPGSIVGMQGDPFGGIYILNSTAIFHFSPPASWNVVTSADLLPGIEISDLAVGPDRTLWVATNNGIYGWREGRVRRQIDTTSGIGSNAVKKIYIDSSQRLWFVTPENVGYTTIEADAGAGSPVIPVTTFELPAVTPQPSTTVEPRFTPGISFSVTPEQPASHPDPLTGLLGTIQAFLEKLLGGGRA